MERLLADAEKISGIHYDISNLADVYNAIHVIQEDLGITGTTAREAMKTIEGSANMTRAAWDNVIIAIGRGEGISEAFDNLLTAVLGDGSGGTGLLNNIIPRIQTVMEGIGNFITQASPLLAEAIPKLIDAVFPSLLQSAISLVGMLAKNLPGILRSLGGAVVTAVNSIMSQVSQAMLGYNMFDDVASLGDGIIDILTNKVPEIYKVGKHMITQLLNGISSHVNLDSIEYVINTILLGLSQGGQEILTYTIMYVTGLIQSIFDKLPEFINMVTTIATTILEYYQTYAPQLFDFGARFIRILIEGIFSAIPELLKSASQIFNEMLNTAAEFLPLILDLGVQIITNIINGILENIPAIISTIGDMLSQLVAFIMENLPKFLEKGIELIENIIDGITQNLPAIFEAFVSVVSGAINTISEHLPEFLSKGQELLGQIIGGIGEKLPELLTTIAGLLAQTLAKIGEHLPEFLSKGIELVGKLVAGLIQSIPDVLKWVGDLFSDVFDAFKDYDWLSIGSNIIQGIIDGLLGGLSDIWDAATNVASSAYDAACDFLGIKSPSKLGRYIGRMFDAGIAEDLEDNAPVDEAISAVESVYNAAQGAVKDIDIPMGASYTSSITSRNKGEEMDAAVLQLLAKYLPMLANMQIVLQDRTVAGKLAPYINEELGALADWEAVL